MRRTPRTRAYQAARNYSTHARTRQQRGRYNRHRESRGALAESRATGRVVLVDFSTD
jgi:hypothetical protein